MQAAILASGEELLAGRRVDTNSSWIQGRLRSVGIEVRECRQVGDRVDEIAAALRELAGRFPVLVATGGLGPTEDDQMRAAAASAGGVELEESAEAWRQVQEIFATLGRSPSPSNRRQALLPRSSRVLPNRRGTAPGFEQVLGDAVLFALPGVPDEMREMLEEQVLPRLRGRTGRTLHQRLLQVVGLPESVLGERLAPWMRHDRPPLVALTAHEGTITVCLSDDDVARLDACADEVRARLGRHLFAEGDRSLAQEVVALLQACGGQVALAESCTGGLVCAALTGVPGVSAVLTEGCVVYSNAAKQRTLDIDAGLLAREGAVSEACARAMAEGVRRRAGASHGAAVTGIAGPDGGSKEKPVGTVHLAVAGAARTVHRRLALGGPRDRIRAHSAAALLDLLRLELLA